VLAIVSDALARYKRAVRTLPATLARDVDQARHMLKRLPDEVRLRPDGEAELRIGAESLLRLVANAICW
jgi:hypothetical protein